MIFLVSHARVSRAAVSLVAMAAAFPIAASSGRHRRVLAENIIVTNEVSYSPDLI